ncbi:MAG: hypothetical protein JNK33_05130 [Candidatus Doudnabacteria bacterium]|nr:hypothetical protein [Candidatus Doudnabacteria bacterium]
MQIGEYVALANLTRGKVCPLVDTLSGVIAPKVGDVVPLQLNQGGVATRIGPTVSTACVELHPWG